MRKNTFLVITALLVAIIFSFALLVHEPDTVPYHLNSLINTAVRKFPPPTLNGYFRKDALLWYLRGRPSDQERREREYQALIRLGYLEDHEFVLQHRLLDGQFTDELTAAIRTNQFVRTYYWGTFYDRPARKIRVIARKESMPFCESIITELDRKVD